MEVKKTVTTIFIVPTLSINKESLKENGFINGYISDERKDVQYKDAVYLLFKPTNLDKFRAFLDEQQSRGKGVIDDYDYENGYVVVVFNINKKWKKDILLVRQGLYSLTSSSYQATFPKTILLQKGKVQKEEISLQHRIFKKAEDLRNYWEQKIDIPFTEDMEVWDGFHIENETLDLDKFKQEETV